MKLLLDTHVLLWLLGEPARVPDPILVRLATRENDLLVSAASLMEIATKSRLGRLPDLGLVEAWEQRLGDIGATDLPITAAHAVLAGSMPWAHRDPFDRFLVAQAIVESAVLVTVDRALSGLPAPRTLTW